MIETNKRPAYYLVFYGMITLPAWGERHALARPTVLSCRHSREVRIGPVACLSKGAFRPNVTDTNTITWDACIACIRTCRAWHSRGKKDDTCTLIFEPVFLNPLSFHIDHGWYHQCTCYTSPRNAGKPTAIVSGLMKSSGDTRSWGNFTVSSRSSVWMTTGSSGTSGWPEPSLRTC